MPEHNKLALRLKHFLQKTLGRKYSSPSTSDTGRDFVTDAAKGIVAQVQHESSLRTARGKEPVSVRLVPQVPVRDVDAAAGWIGGGACLPAGTSWPVIDSPTQLLAQINCSQLPDDLWQGLGPREGWLAIFLDPLSFKLTALHFEHVGPFLPSPEVDETCYILGIDTSRRSPNQTWRFARWPVDIVPVRDGQDDPRSSGRCKIGHERYRERHDIVEKQRVPFDWPTTQIMITKALAFIEPRVGSGDLPDHLNPSSLEQKKLQIEQARRDGASEEEIARMSLDYDEALAMVASHEFRSENGPRVLSALRAIKAKVDAIAVNDVFSQEKIAPLMTELQQLTWMHIKTPPWTMSQVERLKVGIQAFEIPLTTHDPKPTNGWIYEYEQELLDAAKVAYLRRDDALPDALVSDCEEVWKAQARHEMGGMGHTPWGFVHEFNPRTEVTLLELPSSDLIGWMFGDVESLVITIKKSALKRGDFSDLHLQLTN